MTNKRPDENQDIRPSRRQRSRPMPYLLAGMLFVFGMLALLLSMLTLYAPESVHPLEVDPNPLFGLTVIAASGVFAVLASFLIYFYARKGGL